MAIIDIAIAVKMTGLKKQDQAPMIVTQSNELTEAAYYLPLQGKRVLWLCLSDIPPFAEEHDGSFLVSVDSYAKTFGVTIETASAHVKQGASQLISPVWFADQKNPSVDEVGVPWLYEVASRKKKGYWELQMHPKVIPYVLGLKKQYTSFNILNCGALKNTRQIRLYESLSQYKNSGFWTVKPEWLAAKFKLPKSQQNNAGELKRRFLEPALKVINANTPIEASYKAVLEKGVVARYDFTIRIKSTVQPIPEPVPASPISAETDEQAQFNGEYIDGESYGYSDAVWTYYDVMNGKTPTEKHLRLFFPFIDELRDNNHDVDGDFKVRLNAVIESYRVANEKEKAS